MSAGSTAPAPAPVFGPDPVPGGWATRIVTASLLELRHAARALPTTLQHSRSSHSGPNHSPFKGQGLEYAESRPYLAGDEVRHMDWRITARTGKPHTKLFHAERDRTTLIWIDLRHSLFFASRGSFKAVMAARGASLLAWHAVQCGHRLGATICHESGHQALRPERHAHSVLHLIGLLSHLAPTVADADPTLLLEESLLRLRRITRPGSRLFLFGDWNPLSERMLLHLRQLARHNTLVLTFLYDPLEAALPAPGTYPIRDGQHLFVLDSHSNAQRAAYAARFQQRLERLQLFCQQQRIALLPCATNEDMVAKLFATLAAPVHARRRG
ncbi:MAG: DUF58 domain-containing protein [Magnetococcales bacterium]|nr:DUF58 domain-containing protein [Magnetococcales bacterium]MBF0114377.1 DUF58 domain-containing protein [Magnetococcales bacterium]